MIWVSIKKYANEYGFEVGASYYIGKKPSKWL